MLINLFAHALAAPLDPPDGWSAALSAADLTRVMALAEGAEVFALGESFHASGGQYDTKVQVIEHLIEFGGYRDVGMETPHFAARAVGHFVATCEGDASAAGWDIFAVFDDVATHDLFRWMCQWNTAHPDDPVRFWGFDTQEAQRTYAPLLARLQHDFSADLSSCATDWQTRCDTTAASRCLDVLDHLPATEAEDRVAVRSLQWAQGACSAFDQSYASSMTARDQAMADIVDELRDGRRALLWAHNGHVGSGLRYFGRRKIRNLGEILGERLGSAYRSIALASGTTGTGWDWAPYRPPDGRALTRLLQARGSVVFDELSSRSMRRWRAIGDLWVRPGQTWSGLIWRHISRPTFPMRKLEALRSGRVASIAVCYLRDQNPSLALHDVEWLLQRAMAADGWIPLAEGWENANLQVNQRTAETADRLCITLAVAPRASPVGE